MEQGTNPGGTAAGARSAAIALLAVAIASVAGALVYFTVEVAQLRRQLPQILSSLERSSDRVEPVLNEVAEIRRLVPAVLDEIRLTREQIPPVLAEAGRVREQVPPVLKEIEAVRQSLPPVLATADRASAAVTRMSKEVAAARPLVPKVLEQIEITRASIPPMMDRADAVIARARDAGKEASSGAVTGVFSGILMAPFVFVGDVGKRIIGVSEKEAQQYTKRDFDLIELTTQQMLGSDGGEDTLRWDNPDSGKHGTIELVDVEEVTGEDPDEVTECRTLRTTVFEGSRKLQQKDVRLCRNDAGEWDFDG